MRSAVLALILGAGVAVSAAAEPLPTIYVDNIFPTVISPHGGSVVTIIGRYFSSPARVFFDQKEAFIVAVTPTMIQLVAPAFDLGYAQTRSVKVTLVTSAGTVFEMRYELSQSVTIMDDYPQPSVKAVAPQYGRLSGGTRVTIFGDGFQAPVQVFFDDAEAQVIAVTFQQIVVIAPAAKSIHSATIAITNVNASKRTTFPDGYHYFAPMTLSAVSPDHGSSAGGTMISIRGSGFVAPLYVTIGSNPAQVIRVSDSEIVAVTSPFAAGCDDRVAPIEITNIDNGESVNGASYTYTVAHPAFVSLPELRAGEDVTIKIANEANAIGKFVIGRRTITASSNKEGTFTIHIPLNLAACGTSQQTTLTFTDLATGCGVSQPVTIESSGDCGRSGRGAQ
jgi:hypothetical protein